MTSQGGFANDEYLRASMDAMGDMVRVVTREGRVAFANDAFGRRLSDGESTVGQRCYEVFRYAGECDYCTTREVIATGKTRQFTRRMDDRLYSVAVSPVKDKRGENVAAVEVYRDMTLDYNIKKNLLAQNAKMQRDLQLARSMQQALVKNVLPVVDGFELFAGFFPCEAVGGDIFNVMRFGSKLILYVADVSGHGVMPAMLAVFFSRAVHTACSLGMLLPSDIFRYVQKEFLELDLDRSIYITGFIVSMDVTSGMFAYSNAGLSVAPIVFDGEIRELYMSAPPICRWFEDPEYEDRYDQLNTDGRMLLYSDGISDVQSDDSVREKLYGMLAREDFSCGEFVGAVKRTLHTRPQDDLTLLLCRKVG